MAPLRSSQSTRSLIVGTLERTLGRRMSEFIRNGPLLDFIILRTKYNELLVTTDLTNYYKLNRITVILKNK